jgi:hypothetical protein
MPIFTIPVRYGEGIEAENSAALRNSDPTYSPYNRRTHQHAIALTRLIGDRFSVKTLQSMARDLETWGKPKIGRDEFRAEWSLVRYLMRHFALLTQKWCDRQFTLQKAENPPDDDTFLPQPDETLNNDLEEFLLDFPH